MNAMIGTDAVPVAALDTTGAAEARRYCARARERGAARPDGPQPAVSDPPRDEGPDAGHGDHGGVAVRRA